MNTLKSVFWEYPELTDERHLQEILETCRLREDRRMYLWVLRRFLEYGRAADALRFFSLDEIAANMNKLRLSVYASAKWHRLVEVYRAA
jgi:hypothetical protein